MDYELPDFFPASDYTIKVTRPEVWKALSDLDNTSAKTVVGQENVFTTFWFTTKFPF